MEFEIKGSVWGHYLEGMLSLRCQVHVQVEISSGLFDMQTWPSVERSELKI